MLANGKYIRTVTAPGLRSILDRAFSIDTTFAESLECMIGCQLTLARSMGLPIVKTNLQAAALDNCVFELKKHNEKYQMITLNDEILGVSGDGGIHIPNGQYIFVIPLTRPHSVICGIPSGISQGDHARNERVDGHTSLSNREPVHYAGVLFFNFGELKYWTNLSGHYKPPAEDRYRMSPWVRLLLPENKFKDAWREYRSL